METKIITKKEFNKNKMKTNDKKIIIDGKIWTVKRYMGSTIMLSFKEESK